ncbi:MULTISPECIES: lycopene cyclase family protein [unclassified Flavobacterium]|uniref:lycopene cyclase family protein n=1 Tax=unclassified Flavobacterium TaxID=196869 RepID=UPI0012917EB5|nr:MULTISPECIES: lycopene cyclase family protein [unclassified Flavobacterium]MQP51440.1 lycopene cyclase [Flavobacterium sp. LMO9]MQP61332.1 lycopene cyclase [Flavobacterium sp. LMO6]
MQHYHYIFTGSGLSALMTVYEMLLSGKFEDKSILLIDENAKKVNDRTWCFWDEDNLFEDIVSKKWNQAVFANEKFNRVLELTPYQYKKINGLDFYELVFKKISEHKNIHFLNQKVVDFKELDNHCVVKTESETITCNKIFNSIYTQDQRSNCMEHSGINPEVVTTQNKFPLIQQHFVGWFIKSKEAVFTPNCATFMDFSVEQKGNTRFMYVLPTSSTEALLEYTLFSKDLLLKEEYETEIQKYIKNLGITEYEILEKEQGNIPMTCYPFWKHNTKNIINIGSAGGWTKASTGYTFKNATKKSKALVQFLKSESDFTKFYKKDKFWFYDLLLLDILSSKNDLGSKIFSSMFKSGNSTVIFKFLDEETSIWEDLQVIWKCPKMLFVKALFGRIF